MKKTNILAVLLLVVLTATNTLAQELPKPSPAATVEQRIGLTDFKVVYSRPSVKDRMIWGDLVPFDKVWRTGANANTLITFSDDVKISGQAIKAGTYSIFTIPVQGGDWTVMFNSITDGWGTGKYDKANDVITLSATPIKGMFEESLRFSFEKLKRNRGSLVFAWDVVTIDIPIEVDVDKKAWENVDKAVAEATDDNKAGVYRNAAKHSASTKMRLDEGLKWINESIDAKESWHSYWVKADVQHAAGDNAGAIASAKKAIEVGEAGATDEKPFNYKDRLEKAITEFK
ncbi:MAG: DUF2911 domain-containing protein [Flavobacteriaceae bacterium]|nr:DUF2911 domain-containing protein [Flavobacteriaceae bacterium]PCJ26316.1 MAG: hypothetical protein COA97_05915 [Flavobacteriales bacterium]